jgi:hypothetical protein
MRRLSFTLLAILVLFACESTDPPSQPEVSGDDGQQDITPHAAGGPYLLVDIPACATLHPAPVPHITTFEWTTLKTSQDPDEVRWILVDVDDFNDSWDEALEYIRNSPDAPEWSPWTAYDPDNDIGTSWTTPPLDYGRYVFAAHGRNALGEASEAFDFDRNAVKALVAARSHGPILTVTSAFTDPIVSTSILRPPTDMTVPAGAPLELCWSGDASRYCGTIVEYRYSWDILDPDDDEQWDVGWTPYADATCVRRVFAAGTHTFTVEVRDNSGFRSRVPITIHVSGMVLEASMDIRPGACPNRLNPRWHRRIKVALHGTEDFDVADVDLASVRLYDATFSKSGVPARRSKVRRAGKPAINGESCECPPRGQDEFADLLFTFSAADLARLVGRRHLGEDVVLVLSGRLHDGIAFTARDCVRIVRHH